MCKNYEDSEEHIERCYYSGSQCITVRSNTILNLNLVDCCFFNCTSSGPIFKYQTTGRSNLRFATCCFYNLNSANNVIHATSLCGIYHSNILNNPTNNFLYCTLTSHISNNNISYNSLYNEQEYICIIPVESGANTDFLANTFAHNSGGKRLFYIGGYLSCFLKESAYFNNSLSDSIIYVGNCQSSSSKLQLHILNSTFANNYNFKTNNHLEIFNILINVNPEVQVLNCLLDSALPSNAQKPLYIYTNNIEYFVFDDGNLVRWEISYAQRVPTLETYNGYVCEIPAIIPWPSSTPKETPSCSPTISQSPAETPTESPSESPSETPTESPTESPTASLSRSPTESPTESPSETPSMSPTVSQTPSETPSVSPSAEIDKAEKKNKSKNKTGIVIGVTVALVLLILIIIAVIFIRKKKPGLCQRKKSNSSALSSIDLLESNPPLLDSNHSELMSGKEDVFEKTPKKNIFDYALVI